jgi:hypothetical protein
MPDLSLNIAANTLKKIQKKGADPKRGLGLAQLAAPE